MSYVAIVYQIKITGFTLNVETKTSNTCLSNCLSDVVSLDENADEKIACPV